MCLNLSETTILFVPTKFKPIACLDEILFYEPQYHQILMSVHSSLYCKNKLFFNFFEA